ncbi:hypothetical protein HA402_015867 [Bradysia odoriphaga]|nr:hypothetical protein HA402_015867 [Bradysia odoriphaga]
MKSVTKLKPSTILTAAGLLLCMCMSGASAAVKHGYLSTKLDEYYSTIKCLASILDELMIPDINPLFICCGTWLINDWLGGMVLDNCYDHNYHQLNNLTEPFLHTMEETCGDYPKDSFSCKMVFATPIALLVFIIVLILSLSGCSIFMCIRLRYYRRYFEYQKSQAFDSAGSEDMTDETTTPTMKKRKPLEI